MKQKDFNILKELFVLTNAKYKTYSIATSSSPSEIEQQLSDHARGLIESSKLPDGTDILILREEGFKELYNECKSAFPDYAFNCNIK